MSGKPSTAPLVAPGHGPKSVTDAIASTVLRRTPPWWWLGFALSLGLLLMGLCSVAELLLRGVGVWGVNIPVGWGFAIVNFVWWIGIGHAGTLISAILLLLRQGWRTSINRFAEAMTLFAVACAGLFPLLHLGRPWFFYWLLPYPNTMKIWPQFRSPLIWDVFAVSTYAAVSALFWYVGLIPDLATLRDRSTHWFGRHAYGFLAMGWRGAARHWRTYDTCYLLLAGLATPLVVSVHSIVSLDFSVAQLPGWHSTIFPPYFVAGAIYSGFAMVATLIIPLRALLGLEDFITKRHLQNIAKVMLATGLLVAYGYVAEIGFAFYSGRPFERFVTVNRILGPYGPVWFALIGCNVLAAQALWFRRVRDSALALWIVSLFVNVGMWLERFVIVITSLHRDFLPSSWGGFTGTVWDWTLLLGSLGLFLSLLFLFIRFLPVLSIAEMRALVAEKGEAMPR